MQHATLGRLHYIPWLNLSIVHAVLTNAHGQTKHLREDLVTIVVIKGYG